MATKPLSRLLGVDPFLAMLVATVGLASVAPARGQGAVAASVLSTLAVALLFFLHGARLSTAAVVAGLRSWPIHLTVLAATFVVFPLVGVVARQLADRGLNPAIGAGVLLLCVMPSTVQSSIAFTSLARGNVPAAVASATASSIVGVVLTPLLAAWLLAGGAHAAAWDGIYRIAGQLLLPFVVGHALRPFLAAPIDRHRALVGKVDRGVILAVVYTAFSAAVVEGLWRRYTAADLLWTAGIDAAILAVALGTTTLGARALGFAKADEITIVFCGSKKSLASGVPMASAMFPPALVGPMIMPLMLFHQLQLMACAVLAQRYAARAADTRP